MLDLKENKHLQFLVSEKSFQTFLFDYQNDDPHHRHLQDAWHRLQFIGAADLHQEGLAASAEKAH